MPEYLSPGVYIQEVDSGPRPIEGVGTAMAAFVGIAPYSRWTDVNKPVLITSWSQYVERFGRPVETDKNGRPLLIGRRDPHMPGAYLSYAVQGYFRNGGGRCYVTRVMPPDANTRELQTAGLSITSARSEAVRLFTIDAKKPQDGDVQVIIEAPADGAPMGAFTLRLRQGEAQEDYEEVILEDGHVAQDRGHGEAQAGEGGGIGAATVSTEEVPAPASETPPEAGAETSPQTSGPVPAEDTTPTRPRGKRESPFPQEQQRPIAEGAGRVSAMRASIPPEADGSSSAWVRLKASQLVMVDMAPTADPIADRTPRFGSYLIEIFQGMPNPKAQDKLVVTSAVIEGNADERSGVEGIEIAEDVTMVCCPDLMSPLVLNGDDKYKTNLIKTVQKAMVEHCTKMGDRMAILDPPPDLSPQKILKWRNEHAIFGKNGKFAALYYPWVTVNGPDDKPLPVPPCGHMAGVYARNDQTRGVHKAPANEVVQGIVDTVYSITKNEQDTLNPSGVNCIRTFTGRGTLVWGARTLSDDPAWRYINVRRLFNYIEKSIERGTQWVVFEPNDPDLWARVRRDVSAFLTVCWRDGMLFGRSPEEAFYVKCDEELNPPETRDLGRLIIEVGLAPVKPAEFVIFRFTQWTGGGQ